jgi:NAD(P)H-flavin reductase
MSAAGPDTLPVERRASGALATPRVQAASPTMVPSRYRVTDRTVETADTVSLVLHSIDAPIPTPAPGQFTMLYAFGVGEVPISVSGVTEEGGIIHTIRSVGAVSAALAARECGAVVGMRGPFGTDWGIPPKGDLVVVAGGIGLAPLRPVVQHAVAYRTRYRQVSVLVGARTPEDLLYPSEYDAWRAAGLDVHVTVDRAGTGWLGNVGVVTTLYERLVLDPAATTAFVCGPEVMMRFAALGLSDRGVPGPAVHVSLERNMRCGVGLCGHCQIGPLLLCRDGPVVGYDRAAPLLTVKEL